MWAKFTVGLTFVWALSVYLYQGEESLLSERAFAKGLVNLSQFWKQTSPVGQGAFIASNTCIKDDQEVLWAQ